MLSAVRSRALGRWRSPPDLLPRLFSSASVSPAQHAELLELAEVEKVLRDVQAGDVRVFPVGEGGLHGGACADYMVVATGRSDWHVRNIAQAILYKIKQKQKGSDRILMPSVEGQQAGKWVVIDSGNIIIHALEERAREYYDLESIWTTEVSPNISVQGGGVFSEVYGTSGPLRIGELTCEDTPQGPFAETHEEHLRRCAGAMIHGIYIRFARLKKQLEACDHVCKCFSPGSPTNDLCLKEF